MVCKITSTNARLRRSTAGVTLVENVIGMAIALIVMAALCAFALLSARSFAGFSSYTTFDFANRKTMDQMTKDLRMVQSVSNLTASAVSLVDFDGTPLQYTYDSSKQTLKRIKAGVTNTLLTDCTRLSFSMWMRDMTNATFDFFPTTNVVECKAIQIDWSCGRKLLGTTNDDMPQLETVVIRN